MVIQRCVCKNEFQDSMYGNGNRVMNPTSKSGCRCTVCGKEHTTSSAKATVEKKKINH